MIPLSIVILASNEEKNIARCLAVLKGLTDDIIVIENGSLDKTKEIAELAGAKVFQEKWEGYSQTKNKGNTKAKYNWILSLDADEEMNEEMKLSIQDIFSTKLENTIAFSLQRKMVYCGHILHHGSVSNEFRIRLFHKQIGSWNTNQVHEDVCFSQPVTIKKIEGYLWHHSYSTEQEHKQRLEKYAVLSAKQMKQQGRTSNFIKLYFSPMFGFIKNYIFKLGFLDGRAGFVFAKNEMCYVKHKYTLLTEMT